MSIYVDENTKVIVQGITGSQGSFHTDLMLKYGTRIVAGTNPSKAGTEVCGVPVYATVKEAKEKTGANASIIFVPPFAAANAIIEAVDADLDICVCVTENIPINDMVRVNEHLKNKKTRLIGPNCPGIISPDKCKLGIMPQDIHLKGHVGIVSRSGSLTYETIKQLSRKGIGQSTTIGIGGDGIKGTSFLDALKAFNDDVDTCAIVMIGEIGGNGEQLSADWAYENCKKPIVGFIGGRSAPPGKRMGHAGAVVSGKGGSALDKIKYLESKNIKVADIADHIGDVLIEVLKESDLYEKCITG
ncbi:MAG: succinate--CoA ligase subunit alpha [Erysipelotrichaceae bacterium]|nr:succinate--CoA ligase subunit alpha [Erysipelotrichaceae bacterium]